MYVQYFSLRLSSQFMRVYCMTKNNPISDAVSGFQCQARNHGQKIPLLLIQMWALTIMRTTMKAGNKFDDAEFVLGFLFVQRS